uniref:Uncharacterized protein n=1 Tax=Brassica oleracea TaxID=3712 RepID=A0A3P6E8W7_BRAOL|nr:unnamed protein product [Brassica oleracea]
MLGLKRSTSSKYQANLYQWVMSLCGKREGGLPQTKLCWIY